MRFAKGTGNNGRLEAHEIWEYEVNITAMTGVQRLVRLIALCPNCHAYKHFGRTARTLPSTIVKTIIEHAATVNGWSESEAMANRKAKLIEWQARNNYQWTQDLNTFLDSLPAEWNIKPIEA